MRRRFFPAVVIAAFPLFVGCGGGGGGGAAVVATTPLKVELSWAARSRVIAGPASARSAVISLQQGNPSTGGSIQFPVINRQDDPATYRQSYLSPTAVRPGPNLITVVFYADKDGAGAVVGVASKAVNIASDGTGTGDILTVAKVQSVSVIAPSFRTVGQSGELTVSALDGNGSAVAVSPGSATFALQSGGDYLALTADGKYTAKAVGSATLNATLDGKTSPTVTLESRAPGATTAILLAGQSVKLGESKALSVSFTNPDGTPLSVDPSQITFETVSGADVAQVAAGGTLTGQKVGTIRLKVKIPGAESVATPVSVVPAGAITVTLSPLQNVAVAETKALQVSVKDGAGADIPLGTEGIQFALTRGSEALSVSTAGSATGVATGYGIVTATVAGSTSAPQAVFVGTIVTSGSGLKYLEKVVGSGAAPVVGKSATVNYTGSLLNGTIFDSSLNPGRTPYTFPVGVGAVVPGFDEGVRGMKVGGKRLLILPPDLAYGASGVGSIPPNSTLIFDLELLSVEL